MCASTSQSNWHHAANAPRPAVPLDVQASYIVIIDSILAKSDLQTITAKRIREGLQQQVDYDISPQKASWLRPDTCLCGANVLGQKEIKALIVERFDKFAAEREAVPATNGHAELDASKSQELASDPDVQSDEHKTGAKRPSQSDKDDELSAAPTASPPKKKRKAQIDEDAAFAARLQAKENSRARPTRGGVARKPAPAKKKRTPKKKTSSKVNADDDSDLDDALGSERKVNRNTGFHVRQPLRRIELDANCPETARVVSSAVVAT